MAVEDAKPEAELEATKVEDPKPEPTGENKRVENENEQDELKKSRAE